VTPGTTLISIAGATSRAGKTALAEAVLRALPEGSAAAVKFTTTEDVFERCPRGSRCVVCNIDVPYRIVDDARVLGEPHTDTRRLAEAGARNVVWAIARAKSVAPAWQAVVKRLGGASIVVMEGSTIVETARPDLLIFVAHPFLSPERWKPTSAALLARADLVVVNSPAGERRAPAASVLAAIRAKAQPDVTRIADVSAPFAGWAGDVLARIADAGQERAEALTEA
jgi:hypothetical protein